MIMKPRVLVSDKLSLSAIKIFEERGFKVTKFSPHEMMALRGKLGKFKFYLLPKPIQNLIKKIAYDYSNRKMKDTSFILTKK